jgi:hypothetical protein
MQCGLEFETSAEKSNSCQRPFEKDKKAREHLLAHLSQISTLVSFAPVFAESGK